MQGHHDWSYAYSSLSSGKETVFQSIVLFQRKNSSSLEYFQLLKAP